MKIILIQSARTDMRWKTHYDAEGFSRACREEADGSAAAAPVRKSDASAYRVYTAEDPAARQTAELLFTLAAPPETTPLLNEIPLRPWRDTAAEHPLWLWRAMGTAQWIRGSDRQSESRADTRRRASEFAGQLERAGQDCIVICRGRIMAALKAALRARGFLLEGGDLRPRPLERLRATKRTEHCGGCAHNCLLAEAKCHIGQAKAADHARGR